VDSLTSIFLEDPTYVYAALALVWVVLAIVWRRNPTRRGAAMLVVPLLLAAVVFLVSHFVVTDREAIENSIHQIAALVNDGDIEPIGAYLDDDFEAASLDIRTRDQAIQRLKSRVGGGQDAGVNVAWIGCHVEGKFAAVEVQTWVFYGARRAPVLWRMTWVKVDGRWRIRSVDDYAVDMGMGR
jgi:hypothetical protein